MGVVDIVIVCCFLPALFFGIKNGLVKQLVALAVVYFGIKLSIQFAAPVSEWVLQHLKMPEFWAKAVSFVLIFFVVAIVLSLLGRLIEKILQITLLGWLNKLLGIVTAFCISVLLLSAFTYLVDSANNMLEFIPQEKLEESRFYPMLLQLSQELFPRLKELFQA